MSQKAINYVYASREGDVSREGDASRKGDASREGVRAERGPNPRVLVIGTSTLYV